MLPESSHTSMRTGEPICARSGKSPASSSTPAPPRERSRTLHTVTSPEFSCARKLHRDAGVAAHLLVPVRLEEAAEHRVQTAAAAPGEVADAEHVLAVGCGAHLHHLAGHLHWLQDVRCHQLEDKPGAALEGLSAGQRDPALADAPGKGLQQRRRAPVRHAEPHGVHSFPSSRDRDRKTRSSAQDTIFGFGREW